MHPRVLIVGTVPYNTKSTSRAFDAYFHYWEKEYCTDILQYKEAVQGALRDAFPDYGSSCVAAMDGEESRYWRDLSL